MTFRPPFQTSEHTDPSRTLRQVLELEEVDRDLYRAGFVMPDPMALYGGQVAAQALRAAGLTVSPDRAPHSLHGYFLRAGDAERPTVFVVHRDRDGGSYSSRRVEARQDGEVIFSMAASFHVHEEAVEHQHETMPEVTAPAAGEPVGLPRLVSFEGRAVPQPFPETPWPTRFWSRTTADLGDDPLLQACALAYLSDISSGLAPWSDEHSLPGASLDHAVWFHRPVRVQDWLLLDLAPHIVARGRGWYSGTVWDEHGRIVASTVQESLFRTRR